MTTGTSTYRTTIYNVVISNDKQTEFLKRGIRSSLTEDFFRAKWYDKQPKAEKMARKLRKKGLNAKVVATAYEEGESKVSFG